MNRSNKIKCRHWAVSKEVLIVSFRCTLSSESYSGIGEFKTMSKYFTSGKQWIQIVYEQRSLKSLRHKFSWRI